MYLNTTCSVVIKLCICMLSGLIILDKWALEKIIVVLFHVQDYLFYSRHSLVDCHSLCRVEDFQAFLHLLCHIYLCCPCSAYIWAVILVKFYWCNFLHIQVTHSHREFPGPLCLIFIPPLFVMIPETQLRQCFAMYPLRLQAF